MSASEPLIQRLDHLGLISAFCREIGLVDMIDSLAPKNAEHVVSHGEVLLAMILNGLGFHSRTLHMFPDFFKDKPLDKLIRPGIEAKHLNDDALGRTLDCLFELGVSELYQVIAERVIDKLGIQADSVHLDITSFHLDGDYAKNDEDDTSCINLVRGYSRDHRPDLNQVILELICENRAGIPVYMQALSGNTNDVKAFATVTKHHIKSLKAAQNCRYFVGDAALYCQESIFALHSQNLKFITRVPATLKEAKTHLLTLQPEGLTPFETGYSGSWVESSYGGVPQRWLIVKSDQATKKETLTFKKKVLKKTEKEQKTFEKLSKKAFSCEADALDALKYFEKQCQFIRIENAQVNAVSVYKGRGRPRINRAPESINYHLTGNLYTALRNVDHAKRKIGMFILATNEMREKKLDMKGLLSHYKSQQSVERGFRFLKSPEFLTSAIFLKNAKRIEALLMVMTCCLMVYAALEHKIRESLKSVPAFFPSMKNKPTIKPTARWVFLKYGAIYSHHWQGETTVVGLKLYQIELLKLLGKHYEQVYS